MSCRLMEKYIADLSGNPLAMIAGLTTLNILNENPEIYKSLDSKTEYLKKGMISIFQ